MKDETSCRHPDCIFRNRSMPDTQGGCNYLTITGHCRIAGLPERLTLPCNCPRYIPDGTDPVELLTRTWEDEALALYRAGATDKEIEQALALPRGKICKWRKRQGLPPNPDQRGPGKRYGWDAAWEAYRRGASDRELQELLGCSQSAIRNWREKHGLPIHNGWRRRREERERKEREKNENQGTCRALQQGQADRPL